MAYRIVHCRWESGERYCMLVDAETGLPPWYPMLFVTTQIRNTAKSVSMMEAALGAIQLLLEHTESKGIDLEERVLRRSFLEIKEIDALCDQAQRSRKTGRRGEKNKTVSVGHHYKRLSFIATYLKWFAHDVLDNRRTSEDDRAIEELLGKIRSRRPEWKKKQEDRALTDEQFERIMTIIDPKHPDNPFEDERTAIRNQLMVLMLAQLGLRKGELLGVQVGDIDWSTNQIEIKRRHDDEHDPRTRQPKAKTLERTLPVFPELIRHLYDYVMKTRRGTTGANTHKWLLVVHRKGPYEGQPLGQEGWDKALKKLGTREALLENVHAHAFRHTWNWHFSREMDAMPADKQLSKEEQEAIREYMMGWKEGSGTAAVYNRRFIERQAQKAALELAEKTTKANTE